MEPLSLPFSTAPDSRLPGESALDPYLYQPLASRQIRLFAILPAQDSVIGIRLIHADLPPTSSPEYQALSYVWGTSTARHPVHVLSDGDTPPSVIHVGDNLAGLLLRLRDTESEKLLWIDAICINQTNDAEKSHQIPLMGDVYRLATRVIVWLGPEGDGSERAMEYAGRFGPDIRYDWNTFKWLFSEDLLPLLRSNLPAPETRNLIYREWFERLWVHQEVALARRVVVFCGSFEVEWEDLMSTMTFVAQHRGDDAQSIFDRIYIFLRPHIAGWVLLRSALLGKKCSDPRDRIYGMLALIADEGIGSLPVDYGLSTAEVYTLTAKHCLGNMTSENNTLFLCELSSDRLANLPSWVPDWSTDPEFTPFMPFLTRAAGETRPFVEFPGGLVMRLAGVLSSRVKTVVSLGQTPEDITAGVIRALGMFPSPDDEYRGGNMTVGEAIVCALLTDSHMKVEVRGALRYFVALSQGGSANERDSITYKRLLRCLWRSRWQLVPRYNAIILFEDGFIGHAPGIAAPGDRLFFPLGSNVPLLIRRAVGSQEPRWLVVCAAWVTGRMLGQILYGPLPSNDGADVRIERIREDPSECSADEAWPPSGRQRRFGVDDEEDLTPELLTSQGVPVEWLDFV